MNGYMIHHERAIKNRAAEIDALAADYLKIIEEIEGVKIIPGWESEAADVQRAKIQKIIDEANAVAAELKQISADMITFTETHKTWLEDVIDTIT